MNENTQITNEQMANAHLLVDAPVSEDLVIQTAEDTGANDPVVEPQTVH